MHFLIRSIEYTPEYSELRKIDKSEDTVITRIKDIRGEENNNGLPIQQQLPYPNALKAYLL